MNVSDILKEKRKQLGYTTRYVGEAVGCSAMQISLSEKPGNKGLSLHTDFLEKACKLYDLDYPLLRKQLECEKPEGKRKWKKVA